MGEDKRIDGEKLRRHEMWASNPNVSNTTAFDIMRFRLVTVSRALIKIRDNEQGQAYLENKQKADFQKDVERAEATSTAAGEQSKPNSVRFQINNSEQRQYKPENLPLKTSDQTSQPDEAAQSMHLNADNIRERIDFAREGQKND